MDREAKAYSSGKNRGYYVAMRREYVRPRPTASSPTELRIATIPGKEAESRFRAELIAGVFNAALQARRHVSGREGQVRFRAVFGYFLGADLVDGILAGPCAQFKDAPHEFQEDGPCKHCSAGRPA